MKTLKIRIGFAMALVLGLLVCGVASATPVTMNFDGLTPGTQVHNYYDGGCTTRNVFFQRTCGGPDNGVKWKGAHIRWISPNWADAGIGGKMTMNVAGGFDTGLNFYYTTFLDAFSGKVSVYSGTNGHGTELGYKDLSGTGLNWQQSGLNFAGSAKSVVFDGFSVAFGLDNVTIGAGVPVPEPAELGVFGLGLLLLGGFVGLRRRRTS